MTSPRGAASRVALRLLLVLLATFGLAGTISSAAQRAAPQQDRVAIVLHLDGVIGPASADYFKRGLAQAAERGAAVVVLRLDTPGGLDTSMREIIRQIIASPAPVVTYVAPGGARAASAGTFLLYASHVAAMAPGTNLGAATPVQIGGMPGLPDERPQRPQPVDGQPARPGEPAAKTEAARKDPPPSTLEAKATNDAVAYIRALADLRGRNADWAEEAVRQSASLSANEALARGVIDVVAKNVPDALARIDGREVVVGDTLVALRTAGLRTEDVRPDWRHQILAAVTNPNVALILMMIGVYGLLFEFMNPGALYPGAIGVVSLLVGLYAMAILPVNYAGLALIGVGLALMVAEAFAPSFGVLGLGGGSAFVLGAMILIDTERPEFGVSLAVAGSLAAVGVLLSLLVLRLGLTSRRRPIVSGREEMIGAAGVVQDWSGGRGHVFAHSERWRAVSSEPLRPGDRVRISAVDNLTLTVVPQQIAEGARQELP